MRSARTAFLTLALGLVPVAFPAALEGQRLPERFGSFSASPAGYRPLDAATSPDSVVQRSTVALVAGGALGGIIGGAALGTVAGVLACSRNSDDYCGLLAIPGGVVGEVIGMPLGVHFANDRRGSLALSTVGSSLVMGAGIAAAIAADGTHGWVIVLAIPMVQLAGVIAIERATE